MLRLLSSARFGAFLFPLALAWGYGFLPFAIAEWGGEHPGFRPLAGLALLAAATTLISVALPWPFHRLPKVSLRPELFLLAVWGAFLAFVLLVSFTAERIPVIASLQGADANTIAVLRERFLKARVGWQTSFVYVNALFAGFLIPYCLALMFVCRFRFRWICFLCFLVYTLSFAEKAFFFKAMLPLFYLVAQQRIRTFVRPWILVASIAGLLVLVTVLSRVGAGYERSHQPFFSARYVPGSPAEYMLWRAVAIPLVTAADAIALFREEFSSVPLRGATSSFLARLSQRPVVPFERLVFARQWGQNETGTGSANSVYLTEAYVNFGVPGVILFSVIVGMILRLLARARDEAFRSLWLLFCLNIYFAGLIGTLLSNGFILLLAVAVFVRFRTTNASPAPAALPIPALQT